MPGKSSTFEPPLCPAFGFGSASGNSAMDQQAFWNSTSDRAAEIHNLPAEVLSSNGTCMCYESVSNQDIGSTDTCDSQGLRSNVPLLNNEHLNEFNLEIGWTPMTGGVPRLDEGHSKAVTTLSSVNTDIDLNCDHVDNGQAFLEVSNNDIPSQNSGYTALNVATSSQARQSEPSLQSSNLVVPRPLRILSSSSSSAPGSSSRVIQLFPQNGGSRHAIPDGHSLSLKRKNVEVAPGPSSSGSSSRSGNCFPSHEDINVQVNNTNQVMTSGNDPFGNVAGNEETFERNTRMRTSHAHPFETSSPYIWSQGNGISFPSNSSAHHSVSRPIPSDPSLVSSRAGNNGRPYIQSYAPNMDLSSNVHPFTLNGAPVARVSSSNSHTISGGISEMGETSSRTALRTEATRRPAIAPFVNPIPADPEIINLGLANGTAAVSGDVVPALQSGSNIGALPPGANWAPTRDHLDLLEILHVHPPSSEHRGSSVNLPRRNHSPALDENASNNQTGIVPRVRQQLAMRPPHLIGRQNGGILGIPFPSSLTAAARERRRMRAELRNMFDQIRRAEIPPQGILLFDRAMFVGGADFLDRHRDLRLDVDNMSYEELLALEEQIGNVSTGLTEEKIRTCLSHSKYVSVTMEPSKEVESCCICREDYLEGEEMGRLDCGHDFHSACIKQWLKIKNLCPICKTAASSS